MKIVTCTTVLAVLVLSGCSGGAGGRTGDAGAGGVGGVAAFGSPPVDQPSECTIDARALEAAEGLDPGTYNQVDLREPFDDGDLAQNYPICWYNDNGTALPSTTMIVAPYGMAPATSESPLTVMADVSTAEDAAAAFTDLCPIAIQSTPYDNVLICGVDTFAMGPTRWYQHADLVSENSLDDDPNTVSVEELDAMDSVLALLSEEAE